MIDRWCLCIRVSAHVHFYIQYLTSLATLCCTTYDKYLHLRVLRAIYHVHDDLRLA
jgi:hypothetical protein